MKCTCLSLYLFVCLFVVCLMAQSQTACRPETVLRGILLVGGGTEDNH